MNPWILVFWLSLSVLLYVQIGYPALMALVACLPKRRCVREVDMPSVTLIIPAYNEEVVIEAKLRNALRIDYPKDRLEILLASDASDDRTVEIARQFESQGVRVLAFPVRRGKPSTVNDAAKVATGDVLYLCDANVLFHRDALRKLVAGLADPRVGAVTGDVRLASHDANFGEGESLYYRIERAVQRGESRFGSVMSLDGGMYVMRRELFRPLPVDAFNEDYTNTMRVIGQGKRVIYEPAAIATESATPTARQEFRRRARVTAGAIGSLKRGEFPPLRRPIELGQFVSHKLLRWAGPLFLLAFLLSNALLWNQGLIYRAALAGQGLLYLLAAVATVWVGFRQTKLGGISFYFVMSHVAMAIGLVKGFVRMPRITWTKPDRSACDEVESSATS